MRVHIEIWTRQLASVVELLDASTASTERYFNYKLAAFDVFFFSIKLMCSERSESQLFAIIAPPDARH